MGRLMDIPYTTQTCRLCNGELIAPWPPVPNGGPTHHTCHPGEERQTIMENEWKQGYSEFVLTPPDGGDQIEFWWYDIRPRDIRDLIKEMYERGFAAGVKSKE